MQKLLTFFSAKTLTYMPYDQCFNDTLTNDIDSFEQLDPGIICYALYCLSIDMSIFWHFISDC